MGMRREWLRRSRARRLLAMSSVTTTQRGTGDAAPGPAPTPANRSERSAEHDKTDDMHDSRAELKPVTLRALRERVKTGEKFACLTCYDATTAGWLWRAGVSVLLVGDTAAEMILGYPSTIHAPLEFMITITAAVKRGAPDAHVMADMPFMSYQADEAEAIRNAGRFLTEGTADSVKLEVDRSYAPMIEKLARAGVPVVAHIGSRPQLHKRRGGYGSSGRTVGEALDIVADAVACQEAGATMLLIEAVPEAVAQRVVEKTSIPVIGCGAGPACHGQVVVLQDILGLTEWQPAFASPISNLGPQIAAAAGEWVARVRESRLGEHPYKMAQGDAERF
jgi:3-methyl-2-oxobutanoate hydroxymethyltransferase